tara:strand:+ start:213 stop:641 length:429 start_codon:yes stop_codon:yes gene_type:complete
MASILRVNTLTDASSNNSVPMATVAQGTVKYWINYDAPNQAVDGSLNSSSVTDSATGQFTFNINNDFNSANDKCVQTSLWNTSDDGTGTIIDNVRGGISAWQQGASATGTLTCHTAKGCSPSANGAYIDFSGTYVSINGDLA